MLSMLAPRVETKNSGSRLCTSSEERSINRLTRPSVQIVPGMAWCRGSSEIIVSLWLVAVHPAIDEAGGIETFEPIQQFLAQLAVLQQARRDEGAGDGQQQGS